MTVVIDEDYELGLPGWSLTGNAASFTEDAVIGGMYAMVCDTTGGAANSYYQLALPAVRTLSGRALITIGTAVSVNIIVCLGNQDMKLVMISTSVIRAQVGGGTAQNSAALSAGRHLLSWRYSTAGTTYTIDWKIDQTVQTQATLAGQTAADMTFVRHGIIGSVVGKISFAGLLMTDVSAEHPLGPPRYQRAAASNFGTTAVL